MTINSFLRRLSNPDNAYTPPAPAQPIPIKQDDKRPISNLIKQQKLHQSSDNLHVSLWLWYRLYIHSTFLQLLQLFNATLFEMVTPL